MELNIWIALWAGFISFISPCCLPLYPSYLSYITGVSVGQLKSEESSGEIRFKLVTHTLCFIVGFSVVFYTMGLGASAVASLFDDQRDLLRQLSAILIFVMALFLLGIFQPQWLMKERKLQLKSKPAGYLGSLLVGIGFAAGWSPCIGPILSAMLSLAATEPDSWLPLISAYSLGFAIPFFVLAFYIGSTKWILKYSSLMMKIGGGVMLLMAVLLYTDQMTRITIWLQRITPSWIG
ncbi:cytochrome c biogenesis CcdA family protein [Paenibacillus mucilaginosus]|uniref:Cytochrome c biogenesis protein transmembrane region n=3 Tax=Paenibacillus mucilaginosus TaxID=61624 RepID=H6NL47_9BACL|nr:cytochrome c biogenesis protein CcdA [Paenibacillus mucilaginosus]AEI41199.1 cytochrome c biogenesis protein transmembrane region [Paenibacillus mucilaginosus KNP414]AFC29754.1 cytochrome c biogenesis protein transmembrane region [Paenibacillus mucilaginosus 3016]AFH61940.1 cytochrome C biogenesis protein [Paenibacillus mucilaginosus K02]MCG7211375.1 cytochrome C biogenesis protein CcdA [Paenibacillus mucilaginosus]WDM30242.1 cytochrome C biogenesis protein CcdA [Paenibacillus mucilaginosus